MKKAALTHPSWRSKDGDMENYAEKESSLKKESSFLTTPAGMY